MKQVPQIYGPGGARRGDSVVVDQAGKVTHINGQPVIEQTPDMEKFGAEALAEAQRAVDAAAAAPAAEPVDVDPDVTI